jgi:hypothetical protein
MGGGGLVDDGTGRHICFGADVMKELKAVFADPGTVKHPNARYVYAKQNHSFDQVEDKPGNYRALIAAYSDAGCEICARWGAYLRTLGQDAAGHHDIYLIAQARLEALQVNRPIWTDTHDPDGDPRTHVNKGDPKNTTAPTTIIAPFTPDAP